MEIINTDNINEARKKIIFLKKQNKKVVVAAKDDEFNRKIFENADVDMIINLEFSEKKDYLKQRNSGLNEVLAKLAKKNNITIGINLPEILNKNKSEKAVILGRIIQNIELCRRTKTKISLYPDNYEKIDVISFFKALKSSTMQAKDATE